MKNIVLLMVFVSLLCGCGIIEYNAPQSARGTATATSNAKPTMPTVKDFTWPPASNGQDGKGTLGDFDVIIRDAENGKTYDGHDAIIVSVEWINNSNYSTDFNHSFSFKAFQAGVECPYSMASTEDVSDGETIDIELKPGASIVIKIPFRLINGQDDVIVEIRDFTGYVESSEMVYKNFELRQESQ